jgi:hypothetical protein
MKPIADARSVPVAHPAWYLAGTYTTQVFEPSFSFTRGTTFGSRGESVYFTVIDEPGAYMAVMFPEAAAEYRAYPFGDEEWVEGLTVSEVEYWGYPGSQIDFTAGSCAPLSGCATRILSLPFQWGWYNDTHQVRVLVIDVPDGPIGFLIHGPQYRFDQYWTEVAEPILTSIEFLDQ